MTINLNLKKSLIILTIYMISLIIVFAIGRNSKFKSLEKSQIKLEEDLKKVLSNMSDMEKRNDELLKSNDLLEKLNNELKTENEGMKSDINSIKNVTKSTEQKLDEMETSMNNMSDIVKIAKENQRIFRYYIETVSQITEE